MSSPSSKSSPLRRNSAELLRYAKRLQERYILQPFWNNMSNKRIGDLSHIADVDIAEAGRFKYILIEIQDCTSTNGKSKFAVRGDASYTSHADLLEKFKSEIDENDLIVRCRGGGRIQIDPGTRKITVFGYSPEFGAANHEKTVQILRKKYSHWIIEITDEDY